MADPDVPKETESKEVAIARIYYDAQLQAYRYRSDRTRVLCLTTLISIAMICAAIVKIHTPAWETIALAIIIGISPFPIRTMIEIYRRDSLKTHRRTAELEETIDPNRSSSEPYGLPPPTKRSSNDET